MADEALIAHYLRRLTFGPHPGQVDELAALGASAVLEQLLSAGPTKVDEPGLGTNDDYTALRQWYINVMRRRDTGLHERMVWFWHGLLTSSMEKCEPLLMYRQQLTFRTHALGNVRDLLQAITVDGAMLAWLDGSGSRWEAPNENFAREVMELFALGRGNFSEDDVRSGAKAFTGYWLDYENGLEVKFDDEAGPQGTVTLLGRDGVGSAEDAINTICDQPFCADHVAARIFEYLVGREPDTGERSKFGAVMRDNNLDILPTVAAIVRDPVFNKVPEPSELRPKSPVEWFLNAERLLDVQFDQWVLQLLGQVPMEPPNVGGWPGGRRWLSASAALVRAQFSYDSSFDTAVVDDDDPVGVVLWKAGIYDVTDATRQAIDDALRSIDSRRDRASLAHALVLNSPEFALS